MVFPCDICIPFLLIKNFYLYFPDKKLRDKLQGQRIGQLEQGKRVGGFSKPLQACFLSKKYSIRPLGPQV